MTLWALVVRNASNNRFRTIMTVLGGAVAVIAFVLLRTVPDAWNASVEAAAKDRLSTHNKVSFRVPLPRRYVNDVLANVKGVRSATFCTWFGARWAKAPNEPFRNVACGDSIFEVYPEMEISPESLAQWRSERQGAVVGDLLAKRYGFHVGDRITLDGTFYPGQWEFKIVGIYTAPPRSAVDRTIFFFHWDYKNDHVAERQKDLVDWIFTRVDDPAKSAEVSRAIDKLFESRGVVTTTTSERAANNALLGGVSAVLDALDVVSLIILGIMGLILGNTIAMSVRERTTDYAVLRAIGFQPGQIRRLIVGEAMTLALASAILGLVLSFPLVQMGIGRYLEENVGQFFPKFVISLGTVAASMASMMALGGVAALVPAIRTGRMSVTDALRRIA